MKTLLTILLIALAFSVNAQRVEKRADGYYYAVLDTAKISAKTFFINKDGKKQPLYITKTGKLYYMKTNKTGKIYKAYLKL